MNKTLSDQIFKIERCMQIDEDSSVIEVEAVKSFIEQLKSELTNSHNMKPEHVQMLIEQLAGDKLI